MGKHFSRSGLAGEGGEVASWLILAAGLAMAAALAAGTLGTVIDALTSNVAEAAGVGESSGTATSPSADAPESNAPDGPADGGPGAGSPTPADPPDGPADGGPGAGIPTPADPEPTPWPEICTETIYSSCDNDGNCVNFNELACSSSAAARDAYFYHLHYEQCSVAAPSPFLCRGYTRGCDAGFRAILEAERGAHPGDLFLAASRLCDSGHPSCELWSNIAHFVHDNRATLATTTVLGDLIPGPRGVGCVTAVADGSLSRGEITECAIGLGTGLSLPIPSGLLDE